jgi:sucrose-6-phosphate hydrolase SacC (GH32 family)
VLIAKSSAKPGFLERPGFLFVSLLLACVQEYHLMCLRRSALVVFCFALFISQAQADDRLLNHPVFEPVQTTPIFEAASGQWDAKIRERGWVMKDGDVWKMWYTGYDPDKQPLTMKLGYATSKDGITWTRHPQNPIISDFWVEDIMVVRDNQRYLMFAEGTGDQAQLLESTDGIQWKRLGTLDVRLTNGQPIPAGPYGTPTAWFEDGVWNLFYERRDAGIWLARSTDLKVWTNVSDEPIIKPGPEPFDSLMIAMNQVIKVDGKYIAVLHGTGSPEKPRQWCTTLFESDDLLHWKKSAHNPLRPVTENKSSGVLVQNGTGWRLYTMHDKVFVHELK